MERKVFQNSDINDKFNKDGYVVIDLLNEMEVLELTSFFYSVDHSSDRGGFYTTTWLEDNSVRLATNNEMKRLLSPKLESILDNYKYFYGSFFVKKAGKSNNCDAHQDWSCINEPEFTSVTIWCALQDVDEKNGCLCILPRSHRLTNYIRGRHMSNYLEQVSHLINKNNLKPISIKKGQAVIFNQRMIHGSFGNYSSGLRLACGLVGAPAEAKLIHYVANGDASLKILDAENDLFSKYDTFDRMTDVEGINDVRYFHKPMTKLDLFWLKLIAMLKT